MEHGALGSGIRELRRGAGATGILLAVVQIEALPVLFGIGSCSATSGLFSFSVGSMYLTKPSIGGWGMGGLWLLQFSVRGLVGRLTGSLHNELFVCSSTFL